MKITALRLFNVKRFAGRGVAIEDIGDGVNVLCAANEFGKSTSFEALHALFFQAHTGQPKDVKRLQPYSGGNPVVEADIQTEKGRYRLAKQFIGGRRATVTDLGSGRLVAQADEAENFIAGLTRGGTAGPSGLLWVRQGITGIEDRDKREEEDERRVRASLLESVQGEVEAVTGGRRMAEVSARCAEELGRLVTATGRPKVGGPYDTALAEQRRLAAEDARLTADVAALRKDLDDRAGAARHLKDLDDPAERDARRAALEKAQAALDAAKVHGEALRSAQAELAHARGRRDATRRELDTFRGALAKASLLAVQVATAEQARDAALVRHRAAMDEIARADAETQIAETEEKQARDLLARLDAALKAKDHAERLAALATKLETVEALRMELEGAEAALASLAVPAKTVDRLQDLEIEIAGLAALETARQPKLGIVYEPGAIARVTLDGQVLDDGEERGFADSARLDIPGIGMMTLRTSRPAGDNDALRKAKAERDGLLAGLGAENLPEVRRREADAQRATVEIERLRAGIKALAPQGLPALREEMARLAAAGPLPLEVKGDPDSARQGVEQAAERVAAARLALREAQPTRGVAENALRGAETSLASLQGERAQVEASLGPLNERAGREQALADEARLADEHAAEAEVRTARLRDAAPDLASAEAAVRRLRSAEESAARQIADLRERIAGLDGTIRARADEAVEEQLQETREALDAANRRVAAFAAEVALLDRLQSTLHAARSAARDLYLKPVMQELRPLLALLFDDLSITFDEKTLLPHRITRGGAEEDVERLSGGTREQLSILTRLAFARLLARDGRPAPVILDDALVYSDDDRIEKMFDALHRQSADQQIIVFSCRQRAFARLGGRALSMIDWKPED
ncbi:DNA-binding protein [Aquibium carbonis]|uniref:DNA-binding protein n=1 Tax=Aquibium carbonis TaxID=2495581 RepID=A0A3R9Y3M9_9HYPH|nr:AAA family ATPase [Aquibium carbonis]RST83461.1 DNA-binding protein [Aquibium carbonis]